MSTIFFRSYSISYLHSTFIMIIDYPHYLDIWLCEDKLQIIIITVIIIISIFSSTKTKSPSSKLHLMNVTPHSFCDSLEEKMNTINVYCLQQVLENGGCVLAEAEERPMKVLYHNICRNNFWSKLSLKQLLSGIQIEPQCFPRQGLSKIFDVPSTCVASWSFLIWIFFHRFHRSGWWR